MISSRIATFGHLALSTISERSVYLYGDYHMGVAMVFVHPAKHYPGSICYGRDGKFHAYSGLEEEDMLTPSEWEMTLGESHLKYVDMHRGPGGMCFGSCEILSPLFFAQLATARITIDGVRLDTRIPYREVLVRDGN